MAIQFELYKTPHPKDEEGKETYHARVVNFQHIDTDYLAKEIQIATSLTQGDVKSVLDSLSHFMGDRLREGESVHLDGIGYFQIKLNSKEPITSPKLKANQIKLQGRYQTEKVSQRRTPGTKQIETPFGFPLERRSRQTADQLFQQ